MTTRVLAVLAGLAVVTAVASAWLLYARGGPDRMMQCLDGGTRESAELAAWAASVRQAASDRQAERVRERFDESVSEDERDVRTQQIVPALVRAESHVPASVESDPRGVVRATWTCRSGATCGPRLTLLFRRAPGGALRLLGPMP